MPKDTAYTPDLWHGEGIVRQDTPARAANLSAARQEMQDAGSDTLMDAISNVPPVAGDWQPAKTTIADAILKIHRMSSTRKESAS